MTDDLIALIKQMDRCWIERRFIDLAAYLDDDLVVVAPGGTALVRGADAAIESYREFMDRCEVRRFDASGHVVTARGASAVVEYDWDMAWSDAGRDHEAKGREILVLARGDQGWRVFWRMQAPA
jgi:ketosteroid isomerase-like protein